LKETTTITKDDKMKAFDKNNNEVKIGNIVLSNGYEHKVTGIYLENMIEYGCACVDSRDTEIVQ
jgi:hypothetical protein